MKTKLLLVLILGFVAPAWGLPFTHYAADSLRLRSSGSSTASIITILQPLLGLEILEHGTAAKIDGVSADWVKVHAENGYVGWCFSGYLKPIGGNVAKSIGTYISHRKPGTYPPNTFNPKFENVSSIDEVKSQTGYYIQQLPRRFQGAGHAPEILQLMFSDGRERWISKTGKAWFASKPNSNSMEPPFPIRSQKSRSRTERYICYIENTHLKRSG